VEEYLLLDYDIDLFFEVSALQILGNNNNIMLFFLSRGNSINPMSTRLKKAEKSAQVA